MRVPIIVSVYFSNPSSCIEELKEGLFFRVNSHVNRQQIEKISTWKRAFWADDMFKIWFTWVLFSMDYNHAKLEKKRHRREHPPPKRLVPQSKSLCVVALATQWGNKNFSGKKIKRCFDSRVGGWGARKGSKKGLKRTFDPYFLGKSLKRNIIGNKTICRLRHDALTSKNSWLFLDIIVG